MQKFVENWNIKQLKEECRKRGLPVAGLKTDLIKRVLVNINDSDNEPENQTEVFISPGITKRAMQTRIFTIINWMKWPLLTIPVSICIYTGIDAVIRFFAATQNTLCDCSSNWFRW